MKMHEIRSDYLDAIIQYIARKPYNEVHQIIAMISSARPLPEQPEQQATHEVLEEQKPEDLINDNKEGQ